MEGVGIGEVEERERMSADQGGLQAVQRAKPGKNGETVWGPTGAVAESGLRVLWCLWNAHGERGGPGPVGEIGKDRLSEH